MGMLGWVMMGLAIWHFTIFLPDRFWGGIVGAFVGSLIGAIVIGLIIYGAKVGALKVPGQKCDRHRCRAVRRPRRAARHRGRVLRGHPPGTPRPRVVPSCGTRRFGGWDRSLVSRSQSADRPRSNACGVSWA